MGVSVNLESGFSLAEDLINSGHVKNKLAEVQQAIAISTNQNSN